MTFCRFPLRVLPVIALTCLLPLPALASALPVNFDRDGPEIVYLGILGAVLVVSLVFGQTRLRTLIHGILMWGLLGLVIVIGYTYRTELVREGHRVLSALAPGMAINQQDGEIFIYRDSSRHFNLNGKLGKADVRFMVDTGATLIVLTHDDAVAAGFDPARLSYTRPVQTANGTATVAPVKLDNLTIADLTLHDLPAVVAQKGALDTSLLGMNALDRLHSWRIEGDRLIMVP